MSDEHINPFTTPTNINGQYYYLHSFCYDEGMAWYLIGLLHGEHNVQTHLSSKRIGLFKRIYLVWTDIHYKDANKKLFTYKPINHYPYYEDVFTSDIEA